jgi:predicted rRNA methylase YqxC with S4 and FtsJ domains
VKLDKLLARAGFTSSVSEASRKIKEKSVHVDGQLKTTPLIQVGLLLPSSRIALVVRVGRKVKKVVVTG